MKAIGLGGDTTSNIYYKEGKVMKSYKSSFLFATITTLVMMTVLVLAGTALAETPAGIEITDLSEHGSMIYHDMDVRSATATKEGTRYWVRTHSGQDFLLTIDLPKQIPFVQPGGTGIDFVVAPVFEDGTCYDDWVSVEDVDIVDDVIKVTFHITTPIYLDLPYEDVFEWEFWAVTEDLDPRIGTTILEISVDNTYP